MEILKQAGIMNRVSLQGKELLSRTLYLDRQYEMEGVIRADVRSLVIQDAWQEVLKAPDQACTGLRRVPFPQGTAAGLSGKKALPLLGQLPEGAQVKYLMNQCMNGIIQSESYVYQERGFCDKEAYNRYWDKIEEQGCRMYSQPHEEDPRWMDYIPQYRRRRTLFNRIKTLRVEGDGAGCICRGMFSDSYHELNAEIFCDRKSGVVSECKLAYLRAPGRACFDNVLCGKELEGKNLYTVSKEELLWIFGRSAGCYHLVELMKDLIAQARAAAKEG
ncbi:DUF2889 domain-containing protein [bacterium 210820-DFI.6.37]|nr:DUF2889 domain-containing protein [bacterium 210820-DFI.6.37]